MGGVPAPCAQAEPVEDRGQAFARKAVPALDVAQAVFAGVLAAEVPADAFFGKNHPVGAHIGYTYYHLPGFNEMPDFPRKAEAIFAIFAARIARSSFPIRSRLR